AGRRDTVAETLRRPVHAATTVGQAGLTGGGAWPRRRGHAPWRQPASAISASPSGVIVWATVLRWRRLVASPARRRTARCSLAVAGDTAVRAARSPVEPPLSSAARIVAVMRGQYGARAVLW